MTRGSVAKEAIEDACDQFVAELKSWEDRDDEDEDCCGIHVVVTRNVTPGMFQRIRKRWLHGLVVTLSAEGVLELMDVERDEHRGAKNSASRFLGVYKEIGPNPMLGISAYGERPDVYNGNALTPDCVLTVLYPITPVPPRPRRELPIVVVEVEVHHLGVERFIAKAREYLAEDHAALAVAFERVGAVRPGAPADIRVVDEVSFGTAPLHRPVLQNLSTVPTATSPVNHIRAIPASPFEVPRFQIRTNDLFANVAAMPAHNLTVDLSAVGLVTPLVFVLSPILRAAVRGWNQDRQ